MQRSSQEHIMLKSSRKKLIAIGCSYTADWNPFPPWPTHLAEKLNMKCINLGRRGSGNEYIFAKIFDTVLTEKKEDIGLVVIMWSEWQRMDFQVTGKKWLTFFPHNEISHAQLLRYNNIYNATMKSLRHFLMTQNLLKDIPYLMIQGCLPVVETAFVQNESDSNTEVDHLTEQSGRIVNVGPISLEISDLYFANPHENRLTATRVLLNSKIFDGINEEKFIGWPIFSEIGGHNINNRLDKADPEMKKFRISDEDTHPNKEGHKFIAQELYKEYKKIYI